MSVEATHDSRCPVCDEMIREGDAIDTTADGEWAHSDCAATEDD